MVPTNEDLERVTDDLCQRVEVLERVTRPPLRPSWMKCAEKKYGTEPSLQSTMAVVAYEASIYGEPGKSDWDQGYANAMIKVHEWLSDLLRRTEQ